MGSTVELRCTVDAYPPASTLIWSGPNGHTLIQQSVNSMFGVLGKNVTMEDDGEWECTASGQYGGRGEEFAVVVFCK